MTERDFKILIKIAEKQKELSYMVKEFKIEHHDDLNKLHTATRRGIVAFIADIFELTKPLSDSVQKQLPFNQTVIKRFRDASTHQYDIITNPTAHMCLMHCVDKATITAILKLIQDGCVIK